MKILNRNQTDLFLSLLVFNNENTGDVSDLWRVFFSASFISSSEYATILADFNDSIVKQSMQHLQLTRPNGDTYILSGIDHIPYPPPSK